MRACLQIVQAIWNGNEEGNDLFIECEEEDDECEPTEPGCKVTFDAIVTSRSPEGRPTPGYHQVEIIDNDEYHEEHNESHRSSVTWPSGDPPPNDGEHQLEGEWDDADTAEVIAHEAGHLMGLEDEYDVISEDPYVTRPKPGFEDNIMGNTSSGNKPNINQIENIVHNGNIWCPCECCPEEDDQEPENDITVPQNNSEVSSPLTISGSADDGYGGSGVALLDYMLEWDGGSYDGGEYVIDPPVIYISYELGPINLDYYIDPGDWIIITTYATDVAGNTGEDSVTVILAEEGEDTTPPITEKTIGQPQWEDGYVVTPFTPIWLDATDPEPGSGVDYIHYEVWWDSDGNEIVDILMGSENIPGDSVEITFGLYEVYYNIVELRWYAVDNAENVEVTHYQEHFVVEGG